MLNIVIVEDNALLLQVLRGDFERRGHRVVTAVSADAGLGLLAKEEAVDILLSELELGEGRYGFELARVLAERHPDATAILVSETLSEVDKLTARDHGVFAVSRPIDREALYALILGASQKGAMAQVS